MKLKKSGILICIILLTPIISGLYGILHNQLTFTISSEYFTRFKFEQFNIGPALPYRLGAAAVGWNSTWWMGLPMGLLLGLISMIQTDWKLMFKAFFTSIPVILTATFLTGLSGIVYAKLFLLNKELNWTIPPDLINRTNFILVGSMHNFSYIGGLIGLIAGIAFQLRFKKKSLTSPSTP